MQHAAHPLLGGLEGVLAQESERSSERVAEDGRQVAAARLGRRALQARQYARRDALQGHGLDRPILSSRPTELRQRITRTIPFTCVPGQLACCGVCQCMHPRDDNAWQWLSLLQG